MNVAFYKRKSQIIKQLIMGFLEVGPLGLDRCLGPLSCLRVGPLSCLRVGPLSCLTYKH